MTMLKIDDRREELRLLSKVLRGDSHATKSFVQIYTCVIEMCVRKVVRRSRGFISEADIQDMVGEIWLSLLENNKRSLRLFDPRREIKVGTWIGLLARNKTIDKMRTTHNNMLSMEEVLDIHETPSGQRHPGEEAELRERLHLARQAMSQLDSDDRRFLEDWYSEENHPEVLARRYNITVGTVYSRRFKIQEKLVRSVRRLVRNGGASMSPTLAVATVH